MLTVQPAEDPSPGASMHLDLAVDDLDGAEGSASCLVHHPVPPV